MSEVLNTPLLFTPQVSQDKLQLWLAVGCWIPWQLTLSKTTATIQHDLLCHHHYRPALSSLDRFYNSLFNVQYCNPSVLWINRKHCLVCTCVLMYIKFWSTEDPWNRVCFCSTDINTHTQPSLLPTIQFQTMFIFAWFSKCLRWIGFRSLHYVSGKPRPNIILNLKTFMLSIIFGSLKKNPISSI